jgi:hypothetical protein
VTVAPPVLGPLLAATAVTVGLGTGLAVGALAAAGSQHRESGGGNHDDSATTHRCPSLNGDAKVRA